MEIEGEGGVIVAEVDKVEALSSFWRRHSMKVRVYWKEAELKRVEDIVRGVGFEESCWLSCEC